MFLSCEITEETNNSKNLWLLDSGCSNHMSSNKVLFSCLDSSITFEIKPGYDSLVKAQGKGVVSVLTKADEKTDICDVLNAPSLKHNLMSVRQMSRHG